MGDAVSFWVSLHTAIQSTIQRTVKGIHTCAAYPSFRQPVKAPAVLIEMTGLEPGTDAGTGELALKAQFEAYVIVDATIKNAALVVRALACEIATIVHQNTWGTAVSPAQFMGAQPNGFKPELDAYQVWSVTWEHECHRGNNVWAVDGVIPHTVYAGEALLHDE